MSLCTTFSSDRLKADVFVMDNAFTQLVHGFSLSSSSLIPFWGIVCSVIFLYYEETSNQQQDLTFIEKDISMTRLEETWEQAKESLKNDLTTVSYETWIASIIPHRLDSDKGLLYLVTTAGMGKSILESRYQSMIESAVQRAFGASLSVVFKDMEEIETTEPEEDPVFTDEKYLNPKYAFSTFVVGKNNYFAHAASMAVAENPFNAYNPLFLYGGAGLGKTHLMHAIGHFIDSHNPHIKVLYVSSEMFTNELIRSIRENKTGDFRKKYRNIDVLMIDDIQFIEKKESVQEEIFHTFNTLYDAHKQIILSSDRPPKDIATLEERLRSRFEWGLTADIQPPDFETRVAILSKKAELENIPVNEEFMQVIKLIAERILYNIRELEGAFIRVVAYATLTRQEITRDLAKEVLKDVFTNDPIIVTAPLIKKHVCLHFNIKESEMDSKKRSRNLAYPRQIAMFLCREMTDLSLPKIGELFGNRDHTTVLHACDKISGELKVSDTLKPVLDEIRNKIKEG